MHGNGGKGGGLLPSCGREAGREEARGAAKATWLEGARTTRGRGKGEGRAERVEHGGLHAFSALSVFPLPYSD